MPILAVLHILVALYFAVHSIRTRQSIYWLFILFSFPFLGSIAYFFAIYMNYSRIEHHTRRALRTAANTLDPERELRNALDAYEETPTVQNKLRLADAQFERGLYDDAAETFKACLEGPFAADPHLRIKLAHAYLEAGHSTQALSCLEEILAADPQYENEVFLLILARAHAESGRSSEARAIYEKALARYGSVETLVEYGVWAAGIDDVTTVGRLMREIDKRTRRWNKHTRRFNQPLLARFETACKVAEEKAQEQQYSSSGTR